MSIETVSIMGQVNGNITAKDKIELKSTARLHGDIRAKRLTVEDGVTFVGKVEVNPAGSGGAQPQQQVRQPEGNDLPEEQSETEERGKGLFRR
jgi:cytoskeletal protein CcmA (bactofilin family)